MDGSEFLERLHLPEAEHGPLSSSERQMAVLGPIVHPAAHLTAVDIAEFAHRCRI
jgi:hypothetical protein